GWQLHPLECAHGWTPCAIVQRTARTPARRQNGPRSGAHLGTNAATARSAKAEIAESEYCSRFPPIGASPGPTTLCPGWPLGYMRACTGMWHAKTSLGATMTKPKMRADLERSPDADWPPHQPITHRGLSRRGPRRRLGFYHLVSRKRP